MPARRETLEVTQDCGIQPKAADNPHAAAARAVARDTERRRHSIGNEMLKFPRKAGLRHVLKYRNSTLANLLGDHLSLTRAPCSKYWGIPPGARLPSNFHPERGR